VPADEAWAFLLRIQLSDELEPRPIPNARNGDMKIGKLNQDLQSST
jgi:hypothetical protein